MADVALLSNHKTRNLGNLALTQVVQRLLVERYGADHVVALHRLPHPIADLVTGADLGQWQQRLARQVGDLTTLPTPTRDSFGERPPDFASVAKESTTTGGARSLMTRLAHTPPGVLVRARLDRPAGRDHLGALAAVDDVVWNPGGEITTTGTPSSRLLDIDFALERSKRVAMVNFSFEPNAETLAFFRSRAPQLHRVIARDERTAAAMIDVGVAASDLVLAPDAVFLAGSDLVPELAPSSRPAKRPVLGVVLHGLTAIDPTGWARVIDAARAAGLDVEILSSHLTVDTEVIEQVLDASGRSGVTVLPEFTDIPRYISHLSGLHAVLTARFHTAVMGLLAGTIVAGVDTYGTKVVGGLTNAGFADCSADGPDWADQAIEIIGRDAPVDPARIDAARERVLGAWQSVFPLGGADR